MEKQAIVGIGIILFTYILFSWALGRFINRRGGRKVSELRNLFDGAWRLILILGGILIFGYFMSK